MGSFARSIFGQQELLRYCQESPPAFSLFPPSFPFVPRLPPLFPFVYLVSPMPYFASPQSPALPRSLRDSRHRVMAVLGHPFPRFVPPLLYSLPFVYYLFFAPPLASPERFGDPSPRVCCCMCCMCYLHKLQIACLAIRPTVAWNYTVVFTSLYSFSVA